MPARRILELGDPMLRWKSETVRHAGDAALVVRDLRATLDQFQRAHGFGRGISAIQIGVPLRLIYVEFEDTARALVNPEWDWMSDEKFVLWDDCFSFPNLMVKLERSVAVRLRYHDANGEKLTLAASGALSELLQHEMDHQDGVLAVDRALDGNSLATRAEWARRFEGVKFP
ncbi:MAG: peptide deformylase [Bryobacterales bacterium]|nr:peptide deformylase [Bryobacterales bacterium]